MHRRILSLNSPFFYRYYDDLYASSKNYAAEAQAVVGRYRGVTGHAPEKILDVGCGTGNHALLLAGDFSVTGIDIDPGMIAVANRKPKPHDNNPLFMACDVSALDVSGFDLSVSLFNVVSYILNARDLISFFSAIYDRLDSRGILIFDCWNGLAAMLDPPRMKDSTRALPGGGNASVTTKPLSGPSGETVHVENDVTIHDGTHGPVAFTYSYVQRLWTPETIRDLLNFCGFDILSVADAANLGAEASCTTWKIAFICEKGT